MTFCNNLPSQAIFKAYQQVFFTNICLKEAKAKNHLNKSLLHLKKKKKLPGI